MNVATGLVLAVLAAAVYWIARSLYLEKKNSKGCNGDCSSCGSSHCAPR